MRAEPGRRAVPAAALALPSGPRVLAVDLFALPGHDRRAFLLRPGDHLRLSIHEAARPARDGGFAFGPPAFLESPT